jgi:Fic family protein
MAPISQMEPMLPEDDRHALDDLATELVAKASALAGRLHPAMRSNVGDLVRSMNCYYSNLIEGHNTLPVDINRAMAGEFAEDNQRRNLQLEAKAHIEVQQMIDYGKAPTPALSIDFILWVHREFCQRLPDDLLWVENPDTGERLPVVPGELRQRHVRVGRHIPPDPQELPAFLARFVDSYSSNDLSKLRRIVAVAAAHHRLGRNCSGRWGLSVWHQATWAAG